MRTSTEIIAEILQETTKDDISSKTADIIVSLCAELLRQNNHEKKN